MRNSSGDRKRKRSRIVRWIIAAFVVCALAEPVVMYKVLVREKEQRSVATQSLSATPKTVTTAGE